MASSVEFFHDNCLKSWKPTNCPVCCHMKCSDLIKHLACMTCGTKDTLWFCIFCGHVGCGHLVQRHALDHYHETKHQYVMGLQEFKVWDYKMKKFLHKFEAEDKKKLVSFHISNQTSAENDCSCIVCQHNSSAKLIKQAACMSCEENNTKNLWICLSCRHIGCSRKKKGHAMEHYTITKHPHVMQFENFSIWDYKAHEYLHGQL